MVREAPKQLYCLHVHFTSLVSTGMDTPKLTIRSIIAVYVMVKLEVQGSIRAFAIEIATFQLLTSLQRKFSCL